MAKKSNLKSFVLLLVCVQILHEVLVVSGAKGQSDLLKCFGFGGKNRPNKELTDYSEVKILEAGKIINEQLEVAVPTVGSDYLESRAAKVFQWIDEEEDGLVSTLSLPSKSNKKLIFGLLKLIEKNKILKYDGCTQEGRDILYLSNKVFQWRKHRENLDKGERLSPIDEMLENYSVEHANKCFPVFSKRFKSLPLADRYIGDLVKLMTQVYKAQLGNDLYTKFENYPQINQEPNEIVKFTINSMRLEWPRNEKIVDTNRGQAYFDFIKSQAITYDDEVLKSRMLKGVPKPDQVDLIHELFERYMVTPCIAFKLTFSPLGVLANEDIQSVDDYFGYIEEQSIKYQDEPERLDIFKAFAIHGNCLMFLARKEVAWNNIMAVLTDDSLRKP